MSFEEIESIDDPSSEGQFARSPNTEIRTVANRDVLRRQQLEHFETPEGQKSLSREKFDFLSGVILPSILGIVGIGLSLTIFGAYFGFKVLRIALRGANWRPVDQKALENPELLVPIVLAPIIHGPSGATLMLGAIGRAKYTDLDVLAAKAKRFGRLYKTGRGTNREKKLIKLLRDDKYRNLRRRCVPEEFSDGLNLILFDVRLDVEEALFLDGLKTGFAPFAASNLKTVGSKLSLGDLIQLPASTLAASVIMREFATE